MLTLGNNKVNPIYEWKYPVGFQKPSPSSDRSSKEKFIRMKYDQRAFVEPTKLSQSQLGQRLSQACKQNKIVESLKLLAQGAPVNPDPKEQGKVPINVAIIEGHTLMALLLVLNRADVNYVDSRGWTPMHYAADYG